MALGYTYQQFIERVKRHISNDFPNDDFSISDNEILLYINEAISYGLVGQVWNNAKLLGYMEVPDGYIAKFQLSALTQDSVTGVWTTTLPQPPISLPLGYSVNRIYPATAGYGYGKDVALIKAKRVGRRKTMPLQSGVRGWITGNILYLEMDDGSSLYNQDFFAEMPSARAVNLTDMVNIPDDAQKMVFDLVVARMKDRMMIPQDIVQDELPAGNKTS